VVTRAGMEGPAAGVSQQAGAAEGRRILETQDAVGAALTTPGRAGTARQRGSASKTEAVRDKPVSDAR
jgi:hypothetical protein